MVGKATCQLTSLLQLMIPMEVCRELPGCCEFVVFFSFSYLKGLFEATE